MKGNPGTAGIARHTIIYGLGTLLQKGVSFVMLPIYTRLLTPADYGVLALIDMTLDVISIGAGAQLAYAIYRFYHKADTEAAKHVVVSTTLSALAASYTVIGILTWILAAPLATLVFGSSVHAHLIRIAAGGMATQFLLIVPFAYLQVTERSKLVVLASFVKMIIALSLNVLFLVGMGLGIMGILVSTLITNIVIGLTMSVWTLRRVGIALSRDTLTSMLRYAGPMIITQFATFFTTFGDRYFLKAHGGESAVGLYSLAYQFGFLLFTVGFAPLNGLWGPRRFLVAQETDTVLRDRELSRGFHYANFLLFAVAVSIALLAGDVLRLMTTPPYYGAQEFVPFILFAYVLLAWCNVQDLGILMRDKTEYLTLANWAALAAAVIGWIVLIPPFGGLGAAYSAAFSFSVRYALTYYFAQRLWPIRYDWAPTLRMGVPGVLLIVTAAQLPTMTLAVSVGVHMLMVLAYLVFLWNFGPLLPADKQPAIDRVRLFLGYRSTLTKHRKI